LSSPTIEKNVYRFAHEWFLYTPLVETSEKDQHSLPVDFLPPQYHDNQSPSEQTSFETHMFSQQDRQTEHQTSQINLDLTSIIHLKLFEVESYNLC